MKKISSVEVLRHGTLRLNWQGGGYDRVTLTPWMKEGRALERISDPKVFCAVSVAHDGKRVIWNSVNLSMSAEVCMSYGKAYEKRERPARDDAERRAEIEISEIELAVANLESPIKIGDIDANDLTELIEDHLDSLLFLHQIEPTADGWRDLALELAVIITMGEKPIGGRGSGIKVEFPSVGYNWDKMHSMWELIDKTGKSQKGAAISVAKKYKINASTLEVRYSEAKKKGLEFAPEACALGQVMAALRVAADRLEDAHRKAEGPMEPNEELQT